jgi:hypothetical protein
VAQDDPATADGISRHAHFVVAQLDASPIFASHTSGADSDGPGAHPCFITTRASAAAESRKRGRRLATSSTTNERCSHRRQ